MSKFSPAWALGMLAAVTLTAPASFADTPKDTLVIAATIDDIVSLDPAEAFEFSGGDLLRNTYDHLVEFNPLDLAAGYQPGLAESWTVSEDGKTFTFKIRDGIKFQSGNPVTAEDAEFSLRRAVLLEKTPSFILTQFGFTKDNIEGTIKATDASTLVITTDKVYAQSFVLNCLTATIGSIVDKKVAMEHEKDGDFGYEWLKTNTAGSGAYALKSWKANESYVLDVNPDYWRATPAMKRVFVRHIAESASQRLLLEKGDIDVARNLTPEDIAAVAANGDLKVDEDLRGRIVYMSLNQKKAPLNDPKVIEAFKWAIDYTGMTDTIVRGQYTVHQAFLPLTYLGELKDQPYTLDIAKAKSLLAEAGHADDVAVKINVRNEPSYMAMAQAIQGSLTQAGIKVELTPMTGKQSLGEYRERSHDVYLGAWGPDYPDPHTNADTFAHNPNNSDEAKLTGKLAWRNSWDIPEMTKETEAAVQESDRDKRAEMYRAIQKEHQMTSPFVVMFQKIEQTGLRKDVENLVTGSAISAVYYWTVTK
ncbi:ABC transporter substrate-binding protein [Thalassobaculum salexigens]|uniref:ABC transporter substrate-binding protein n=1 Tax=Thalassobaculum salexigens TaxID=455360 RepID=UPI00248E450A|nr:ABC transporter substrate-binding protein [Thalassobaculum salexigens]